MSLDVRFRLPVLKTTSLERAVLETLCYSDVFDYPLRFAELQRYSTQPASSSALAAALSTLRDRIGVQDGYYFLPGRAGLVSLRERRAAASRPAFQRAMGYGRLLGSLPVIRMIGLTGSLAVRNCDEDADLDYMIVAAPGRVWTARACVLIFNRWTRRIGSTLCPNLIVSEGALEWKQRDLYSARELCQMIPIRGAKVYERLRQANPWTHEFLPNAVGAPLEIRPSHFKTPLAGPHLPILHELGDRIERWERERKIERFTHQAGFGSETAFSADLCQGNFDHHGARTLQLFQERLEKFGIGKLS